ncbi:SOS response-associated peptidase family protein, partial [Escherichia coli]|nr:SOS response-associated peptidase family protein [Escherichia coli]
AATSHMFKPLWQHGRAICFADGWFEWKKEGDKKQPYFIYRADGQAVFIAAIGSTPFERGDEAGRSFCKPAQGLSVTVAMAVRANL